MTEEHTSTLAAELKPQVKRVMVATDLSAPAERALTHGVHLAETTGAELEVIHVSDPLQAPPGCSGSEYLHRQDRWRHHIEEELRLAVQRHATQGPGPKVELIAVEGSPAHEIVRAARDRDADLIIVATHGRTGLRRVILGSTAEQVVRFASCPVLVVREKQAEVLPLA